MTWKEDGDNGAASGWFTDTTRSVERQRVVSASRERSVSVDLLFPAGIMTDLARAYFEGQIETNYREANRTFKVFIVGEMTGSLKRTIDRLRQHIRKKLTVSFDVFGALGSDPGQSRVGFHPASDTERPYFYFPSCKNRSRDATQAYFWPVVNQLQNLDRVSAPLLRRLKAICAFPKLLQEKVQGDVAAAYQTFMTSAKGKAIKEFLSDFDQLCGSMLEVIATQYGSSVEEAYVHSLFVGVLNYLSCLSDLKEVDTTADRVLVSRFIESMLAHYSGDEVMGTYYLNFLAARHPQKALAYLSGLSREALLNDTSLQSRFCDIYHYAVSQREHGIEGGHFFSGEARAPAFSNLFEYLKKQRKKAQNSFFELMTYPIEADNAVSTAIIALQEDLLKHFETQASDLDSASLFGKFEAIQSAAAVRLQIADLLKSFEGRDNAENAACKALLSSMDKLLLDNGGAGLTKETIGLIQNQFDCMRQLLGLRAQVQTTIGDSISNPKQDLAFLTRLNDRINQAFLQVVSTDIRSLYHDIEKAFERYQTLVDTRKSIMRQMHSPETAAYQSWAKLCDRANGLLSFDADAKAEKLDGQNLRLLGYDVERIKDLVALDEEIGSTLKALGNNEGEKETFLTGLKDTVETVLRKTNFETLFDQKNAAEEAFGGYLDFLKTVEADYNQKILSTWVGDIDLDGETKKRIRTAIVSAIKTTKTQDSVKHQYLPWIRQYQDINDRLKSLADRPRVTMPASVLQARSAAYQTLQTVSKDTVAVFPIENDGAAAKSLKSENFNWFFDIDQKAASVFSNVGYRALSAAVETAEGSPLKEAFSKLQEEFSKQFVEYYGGNRKSFSAIDRLCGQLDKIMAIHQPVQALGGELSADYIAQLTETIAQSTNSSHLNTPLSSFKYRAALERLRLVLNAVPKSNRPYFYQEIEKNASLSIGAFMVLVLADAEKRIGVFTDSPWHKQSFVFQVEEQLQLGQEGTRFSIKDPIPACLMLMRAYQTLTQEESETLIQSLTAVQELLKQNTPTNRNQGIQQLDQCISAFTQTPSFAKAAAVVGLMPDNGGANKVASGVTSDTGFSKN